MERTRLGKVKNTDDCYVFVTIDAEARTPARSSDAYTEPGVRRHLREYGLSEIEINEEIGTAPYYQVQR
jgi:hypothetical protein